VTAQDATRRFLESEERYARSLGLEHRTSFVSLPSVSQPVRMIETGSGPTVLMVHGGPAFAGVWLPLMARLRGMRLVAVDRPGYGVTGPFGYAAVDYPHFAATFLDELLTALEVERVPVIASSMGSLWTMWLAQRRAERFSAMVHLGCPPLVLRPGLPLAFRLLGTPIINRLILSRDRPSPAQVRRVFTRMGHREAALDGWNAAFWDLSLAFEELPDYQRGWLAELERVGRMLRAREGRGLGEADLRQIDAPSLLLWGARDPFGPPTLGRAIADAMPHAVMTVVGDGHLPWLDEPVACAEQIRAFLGRSASAPVEAPTPVTAGA